MDAVSLARLQFGLTAGFHYIFPVLSIGLGLILVIMEGLYLKTKDPLYERMTRFWVKIFGLIFAIGVATGIVLEFQFGTNWSTYSRYVGDIFGSALASEAIFAFFLESGFLAILLFGWDKVSPRWHFFATVMVCLGAHFSAVWIVVANSWQQTPAGHHIVTDSAGRVRAEITDFWAMVFNPSSVDRLSHVYMGCWQAGAFLVLSVSAYYLLRRRHEEFARTSMKIALVVAAVASLGQLFTGHRSAHYVAEHQPAKLAAFEGHYPKSAPADMLLVGWVDEKNEQVHGLKAPGMLSWLLHFDRSKPVRGLKDFRPEDRPPVQAVFQSYHLMVLLGLGMIGLSLMGLLLWWRKKLFETRWLLWAFVLSVLAPQLANQLGWFTAEVGRQPWIVYGLLRTKDAASKSVTSSEIIASLVMFGLIYLLLFSLFVFLLNHKIKHGPDAPPATSEETAPGEDAP
ncbi:MAG: cytochrome ubiquinol oxidase subunit I [bacterium]